MTFKEINQKYTEIVSGFIAKGYTINTATMSGTQGELASVDFTDGTTIYRVLLERFNETDRQTWKMYEGYCIIVGKADPTAKITPNTDDTFSTVWNNHLSVIIREKFYQLSQRWKESAWFGTKEEADEAIDKHNHRYNEKLPYGRTVKDITSFGAIVAVIPFIRRKRNIKNVDTRKVRIQKITDSEGTMYTVNYCNDTYILR